MIDFILLVWAWRSAEETDDKDNEVTFGFPASKVGTFWSMISMDDIVRWNSFLPVRCIVHIDA
jgi:hypothetical protein